MSEVHPETDIDNVCVRECVCERVWRSSEGRNSGNIIMG